MGLGACGPGPITVILVIFSGRRREAWGTSGPLWSWQITRVISLIGSTRTQVQVQVQVRAQLRLDSGKGSTNAVVV